MQSSLLQPYTHNTVSSFSPNLSPIMLNILGLCWRELMMKSWPICQRSSVHRCQPDTQLNCLKHMKTYILDNFSDILGDELVNTRTDLTRYLDTKKLAPKGALPLSWWKVCLNSNLLILILIRSLMNKLHSGKPFSLSSGEPHVLRPFGVHWDLMCL